MSKAMFLSFNQLADLAKTVGGIPVNVAFKGRPGSNAGLQRGDIVIKVNGIPTPTTAAYFDASHARHDKNGIREFDVWRDGKVLQLQVDVSGASMTEKEVHVELKQVALKHTDKPEIQ